MFQQTVKLTTHRFPDGSGQIGVAPGWKVQQAGQGTVQLAGPGGAEVTLGVPLFVVAFDADEQARRQLAGTGAEFAPNLGGDPRVPRVHHTDPVRTTLDLLLLLRRQGLVRDIQVKGVEPFPQFPVGRAVFLRLGVVLRGKPLESFSLCAAAPVDARSGMYYTSGVTAPRESYAKLLPTMMAMWRSWSISSEEVNKRLDAAHKTLGEIDVPGKLDAITQDRRRAAERAAREFQGYIRG